ncbi:DNA topoisomerase IB [Actinomadura madurae]|uniref:DNA topoisomerase IB n=1 Tax=Actinomadura madurae TaxID=1993 RepID=UPI0020270E9A|nr:DNA topoisomerase IB [Actinomadura madurae]MCP9967648.1 DNA topoisomerase IB [Actinomadura madurae]MCP9980099.1 DNA topoisomerase IB [Actinomadura madurae]MCQ0016314.1 DNA topoisomerase IB [Actinomadura madurae]URM96389.1 DNA topoisomerase IB [Actinomadura madurae]URN07097.1 DNA topoisomerase IB [Actinomadura madurae]
MRQSDPNEPGYGRRKHGKGWVYLGLDGRPLGDPAEKERIRSLVIPPAWKDVWICPDADGHIQAIGTDAAGRRQYLYHETWREQRDREKHEHVLELAERLPKVRDTLGNFLAGRGYSRERVLAAAVRLIDLGFFRIGGEAYAAENQTYGLATVLREHVTCRRGHVTFEYPAKGSKERYQAVAEENVCKVVSGLKRRGDGGPELLAYRTRNGWHDVTTSDINDFVREVTEGDFTAKDFRTWHATVLAAVGLAVSVRAPDGDAARRRAIVRVVKEVASYLGNTPAVARASYIDPRIIELYEQDKTIAPALDRLGVDAAEGELATQGPVEEAVLDLLRSAP